MIDPDPRQPGRNGSHSCLVYIGGPHKALVSAALEWKMRADPTLQFLFMCVLSSMSILAEQDLEVQAKS